MAPCDSEAQGSSQPCGAGPRSKPNPSAASGRMDGGTKTKIARVGCERSCRRFRSLKDTCYRAIAQFGERWPQVSAHVQRSPEECRLQWRDYGGVYSSVKLQRWSKEETGGLRQAVLAVCQEKDIGVGETPDTAPIPWQRVAQKFNEMHKDPNAKIRNANQCMTKWARMASSAQWGKADDQILVSRCVWLFCPPPRENILQHLFGHRLSQQRRAVKLNDFTEVDFSTLRTNEWSWPRQKIRGRWKELLRAFVDADLQDVSKDFVRAYQKHFPSRRES